MFGRDFIKGDRVVWPTHKGKHLFTMATGIVAEVQPDFLILEDNRRVFSSDQLVIVAEIL
jgi:hypothetical protein